MTDTRVPTADVDAASPYAVLALDAVASRVAVLDADGVILTANRRWREAAREAATALDRLDVGDSVLAACDAMTGPVASDAGAIADAVRDGLAGSSIEHLVELYDPSSTPERWLRVRVSGGAVDGAPRVVLIVDDVTEHRHVERMRRLAARGELEAQVDARMRDLRAADERLRATETTLSESELRFRAAASATADLIAEATLDDDRLQWFGDVDTLMGCATGLFPRRVTAFRALFHPDDAARVERAVGDALRRGEVFRTEVRVRAPDGAYRHWESRGRRTAVVNGKPTRVVVAFRDITVRKRMEQELRESEARFRAAAASTADVIVECNLVERWLRWYGDVDTILGYGPGEFPREAAAFEAQIHPDDVGALSEAWRRCDRVGDRFQASYRVRGRDGAYHDWESYGQVTALRDGVVAGFVGAIRDVTERKRLERARHAAEADLHQSQQELRALAARLFATQEDQHRSLARELHDSFNQQMAAISIQIGALRQRRQEVPPAVRRELARVQDQVVELSNDLRRVSHDLHPATLEQLGLVAALEAFCGRISGVEHAAVRFEAAGAVDAVPRDVALCLYRVAQEALRNAVRHAAATTIRVEVRGTPTALELRVTDDGRGFDVHAERRRGSLGLVSMQERVRPLGGQLALRALEAGGTEVVASIPLDTGR